MRAAIDYKSLDMEVVGEAASGIEAINIIDDIKPNFLVDVPYETQFDNEQKAISFIMSSGRQRIDLMEAKNVETPSYRYSYRRSHQ